MFPDSEIAEAAGVLDMISQTPEERRRYQARLKFQRDEVARAEDEAARLETALQERDQALRLGEEKGRRAGELIGRIEILQELLGVSQPAHDEMFDWDEVQLNAMAEQLQQQLRTRDV